ncbi:MAG: Zn-ribbon domain-containing protein [Candidatus Woesearchaeota archaeon]
MPHQCVRCNTLYPDGAKEILSGCKCGGKLFFYIKKSKLESLKKATEEIKLNEKEKTQIEKDVRELVGSEVSEDEPVVLDIESIRIKKPGQYEIDLVHLFKGDPLVFKLEEGKYMIDVIETFNKFTRRKLKRE